MEIDNKSMLIKIRNWQNLYGVRRGNFKAYKKFTKRRSKKIRKKLNISFGRKFSQDKFEGYYLKPVGLEEFEDTKIQMLVESLLLQVEKNYINFQESKQQVSKLKKRFVKKKLKKAQKLVKLIIDNYGAKLSKRKMIELKIYEASINSAFELESKNFKEAKELNLFLQVMLKELIERSTAVEKAQIEELMDSVQQTLRYCKFQLREFGDNEQKDMLLVMNRDDINEILEKINDETVTQTKGSIVLNLFGKEIDVDDKKLLNILTKDSVLKKSYSSNTDPQAKEDIFWEMANNYEEGIKICHGYKIEAGNNASLAQIWDSIDDYFNYQKISLLMKRNLRVFQNHQNKQENEKEIKPQENAKLLEMLLSNLRKLIDLNGKHSSKNSLLSFLEDFYRLRKCYYISLLYYTNKMYMNSLSLIDHEMKNLDSLIEFNSMNGGDIRNRTKEFDESLTLDGQPSLLALYEKNFADMELLKQQFLILGKQTRVALYDEQQTNLTNLTESFGDVTLQKKFDKSKNMNCLMDLVVENRKSDIKEFMDFIKVPPASSLVTAKPVFIDLADDFVEYPDVDYDKIENPNGKKKEEKGFFSKFWGS